MERQTGFDDQHILWRAYKQVNIGFEASDEFVFHKVWRFTPIIPICVELLEIWMDTKVPSKIGQCIFIQVLIERSLYSSCLFSNVDSSRRLLKSTMMMSRGFSLKEMTSFTFALSWIVTASRFLYRYLWQCQAPSKFNTWLHLVFDVVVFHL